MATLTSPASILVEATKIFGFKPAVDGMMSAFSKKIVLDILAFDEQLGARDSEYDPKEAMYKGADCSIKEYVQQKYGSKAVTIIEKMI